MTVCLQAAQLQGILNGDVEAYLADRHVADVLADFPTAHLPLTEVRSAARPINHLRGWNLFKNLPRTLACHLGSIHFTFRLTEMADDRDQLEHPSASG